MLFDPSRDDYLGRLEAQLRRAPTPTAALWSDVIAQACVRLALQRTAKVRMDRLIEAGAFTDAALTLIELELPHWKLRRLVHDDGEWLCSLSRQPGLPLELDDELAEATHESPPLAILLAFIEARQVSTAHDARPVTVPQVRPLPSETMCCDNFA